MYSIPLSEVPDLLEIAWDAKEEIVPCLLGAPGIGKTQAYYQFGERKNANIVEMILSQRLPTEISGLTMPDAETKSMEVFDHSRLASLKDGDILLFDELLEAPPVVLSACLTLIQERRMMSGKMLPNIMICAAANPLSTPTLLKLSQRQRFMFIEVMWEPSMWRDYIKRTLDVKVTDRLIDSIHFAGDTYNVLTPRTCTKLLSMGIKCVNDNIKLGSFRMFCNALFDDKVVTEEIINSLKRQDPKKLVADVLKELILNGKASIDQENNIVVDYDWMKQANDIIDNIEDTNINDMIDLLQQLPNWNQISDELSKIEFVE